MVRRAEEERPHAHAQAGGKHLAEPIRVKVLGRMKAALPSQIESLFARHPALCGFSVFGHEDVPDNCPRGDDHSGFFVGEIGIAPQLSREQYGEIFEEIVSAVADLLAEQPEAGDSLRGRTFARVLH